MDVTGGSYDIRLHTTLGNLSRESIFSFCGVQPECRVFFYWRTTMKTCTRCGETKPVSDFHWKTAKHKTRRSWCKRCGSNKRRAWRWKDPDKRRANQRKYNNSRSQKKVAYNKQYNKTHQYVEKAHNTLNHSIDRGDITRPDTCEHCCKTCKPEGHHDDYSKPLEVKWLCPECHAIEHGHCEPRTDVAD